MEFQIYKLNCYSITDIKAEEAKETYNDIDVVVELLKTDKGYNERLYEKQIYKFYLDIEVEGLEIEKIQDSLIDYFTNKLKLKLTIKDIKYTTNDKKFNKCGSYHITIPKYYSELENLKLIAIDINTLYNFDIDKSVYSNKRWFRLPNQRGTIYNMKTKITTIKYEHIIKNGKLKDFVLQYVDKNHSTNLKKYFENYKPVLLVEKKTKPKKEQVKKNVENVEDVEYPEQNLTDLDLLLKGLSPKWISDNENWINLGYLLFSVGSTVEKWIEQSKKNIEKFVEGECESRWEKFKFKKFTMATLHYWVKNTNNEYYSTLRFNVKPQKELVETIKINKQYLTKQIDDKLEIDDDLVPYFDDMFINKKYKSINIKSPYGSSKTQLIKKVIENYNPKKILWLSFRQTLSDDIENNFKELNFKHYQTSKLDVDRLIIQEESLLKLQSYEEIIEGDDRVIENITHTYDLIMMDEVESLLNQYHSQATFGSKTKETFEYLEALLYKCKNIISLDGDLGDRSKCFLMKFDNYLFIENLHKNNNKVLNITDSRTEFDNEMYELLKQGKKIAIASMTSKDATDYKNLFLEKYPKLKIGIYISSTDCKSKKDLKNVIDKWSELDVVIYSPTITAGVSFDVKKYFYKIFGVISCGSCCPRDFYQMLARIRYPELNDITVFNNNITGKSKSFFTFDEVKNAMIETRKLKIIYKDGKSRQDIDFDVYTINYIYNKTEDLNKLPSLFMNYLYYIGTEKGYTINFSSKEDTRQQKIEKTMELQGFEKKNDKIINAKYINKTQYTELLKKQNKQETTEEEHFIISNKTLELQMGLKIDKRLEYVITVKDEQGKEKEKVVNLMEQYINNPSTIKNFSYLIDIENLKEVDDAFTENKKKQLFLINEFFQKVGVNNVYSTQKFKNTEFKKLLKGLDIYKPENQIIFNKDREDFIVVKNTKDRKTKEIKTKIIKDDTKTQIDYINSILENYKLSFRVGYDGKREEKNKYYQLKRLDYIDEVMYYKKVRKQVKDTNKLISRKNIELKFENNFKYYDEQKTDFINYLKNHFSSRRNSWYIDNRHCDEYKMYLNSTFSY
jgi:hypothetical protein